ncbi:MAG TPA: hypothetical protein VMW91_00730 [Desulfosporosinus sp.]|nr:hypothetical protein [Desulfosporosinus sp.]
MRQQHFNLEKLFHRFYFKKHILITLLILLLLPGLTWAANHYVRSGANGNNSGSDWTNAYTSLPSTLIRGDTYYIADGNYGPYTFNDAHSGSTYIYIKKATTSDHGTETGWSAGYGDGVAEFATSSAYNTLTFSKGYYELDGQVGGGPGSWKTGHGFKISNSSSTASYNYVRCVFFNSVDADYVTIKHADIELRGRLLDKADDNIYDNTGASNVTISYCYVHNGSRVHVLTGYGDDWTFEYNYFYKNSSNAAVHGESFAPRDNDGFIVRYNMFVDCYGSGVIYLKDNDPTWTFDRWEVYGNIFYHTPAFSEGACAAGVFGMGGRGNTAVTNLKFYNNSISGINYVDSPEPTNSGVQILGDDSYGNEVYNNVWYNSAINTSSGFVNVTRDYNFFYDTHQYNSSGTDNAEVLAGGEDHSQLGTADPFTDWENGDFSLTLTTNAANNGANLGAPYNTDMNGNTRGADGYWDMGALEAGDDTTPSTITDTTASEFSCTENPRNVTMTWTTNEICNCRIDTSDKGDYDDATADSVSNTDSTSHSDTESFACDDTYNRYVYCEDPFGNESTLTTITFDVLAEPPPPVEGFTATMCGEGGSASSN